MKFLIVPKMIPMNQYFNVSSVSDDNMRQSRGNLRYEFDKSYEPSNDPSDAYDAEPSKDDAGEEKMAEFQHW
jgi:hypothetical protein